MGGALGSIRLVLADYEFPGIAVGEWWCGRPVTRWYQVALGRAEYPSAGGSGGVNEALPVSLLALSVVTNGRAVIFWLAFVIRFLSAADLLSHLGQKQTQGAAGWHYISLLQLL